MTTRIDFTLSKRYGVVEQAIFRLVLNGVADVRVITNILCLYSDQVIANAIKRLVSFQILSANTEARTLTLSDPLLALIERCTAYNGELALPEGNDSLSSSDLSDSDRDIINREILHQLLPGINIGFLTKSLDFVVYNQEDPNE